MVYADPTACSQQREEELPLVSPFSSQPFHRLLDHSVGRLNVPA